MAARFSGPDEDDEAAPLPVKTLSGEVIRAPRMTAQARALLGKASAVSVEGITVEEDDKIVRLREQMEREAEKQRCCALLHDGGRRSISSYVTAASNQQTHLAIKSRNRAVLAFDWMCSDIFEPAG